jgi:hypothetical protein
MSSVSNIALVAALVGTALGSTLTEASARGRPFPMTLCGPDLAFLCPIHGYFDLPPFHYSLAFLIGKCHLLGKAAPSPDVKQDVAGCASVARYLLTPFATPLFAEAAGTFRLTELLILLMLLTGG